MSLKHLAWVAALAATAMLAFGASSAIPAAGQPQLAGSASKAGATQTVGALNVRFTVNKFVKRGKRLYAVGAAIAQFKPAQTANVPSATQKKAFVVPVKKLKRVSSAQRICPILDLTLGPLDLNLLGLMVHLDRVHLTITADSEGGLLGSLLCSLSGTRANTAKAAAKLTKAVRKSGLSTKGINLAVPLQQKTTSSGTTMLVANSPMVICNVLDLTLGPLDLNLLGLMVHLDTVHLVITADSEGGILGSLLCSLAGGGRASP